MISSMLEPSSRFSKTVATGIRVSRNTHAPLRLSGTLSTAGHCDQSRIAIVPTPCYQVTSKGLQENRLRGNFHAAKFHHSPASVIWTICRDSFVNPNKQSATISFYFTD